jgi:hypothetical protein
MVSTEGKETFWCSNAFIDMKSYLMDSKENVVMRTSLSFSVSQRLILISKFVQY